MDPLDPTVVPTTPGLMLVNSEGGVYQTDVVSNETQLLAQYVFNFTDIAISPTGVVYANTFTGLYELDLENNGYEKLFDLSGNANGLAADEDGNLYIGYFSHNYIDVVSPTDLSSIRRIELPDFVGSAGDVHIHSDRLYYTSFAQTLITIDLDSGEILNEAFHGLPAAYGLHFAEGQLYAYSGTSVFELNVSTGEATEIAEIDILGVVNGNATSPSVEVTGTQSDDILRAYFENARMNGFDGADQFIGSDFADWITPGAGNDVIDGGGGNDMVNFVDATAAVMIDLVDGVAQTGADTNTLTSIENATGSIFGDFIVGNAADNRLRGLGDYDWFVGSEGSDFYDGGTGLDMVSYVQALAGVTVNLAANGDNEGLAAGDRYDSVERVTGSSFVDVFYGDSGSNDFRGLGGYDIFFGSAGGRERFDGGAGLDTVSYALSGAGVIANLSRGFGSGGDAARDLYTSIENLGGTSFQDTLTGDDGRNNLRGLAGDDFLFGEGSIDRLYGGRGNDLIDGGDGSDYALYDGVRADYQIIRDAGTRNATVEWIGQGAGEGLDVLTNIEYFVFEDQTVDIWSL